jgi:hypothetical protein
MNNTGCLPSVIDNMKHRLCRPYYHEESIFLPVHVVLESATHDKLHKFDLLASRYSQLQSAAS